MILRLRQSAPTRLIHAHKDTAILELFRVKDNRTWLSGLDKMTAD